MSFNHTGERVVTTSVDATARVWNVSDGHSIAALRGHNAPVTTAAFNPDATRVVTTSEDTAVVIWDVATQQLRGTLRFSPAAAAVAFSNNGDLLAIAGQDGVARIYGCEWTCTLEDVGALARERSTRTLTDAERQQFVPGLHIGPLRLPG